MLLALLPMVLTFSIAIDLLEGVGFFQAIFHDTAKDQPRLRSGSVGLANDAAVVLGQHFSDHVRRFEDATVSSWAFPGTVGRKTAFWATSVSWR